MEKVIEVSSLQKSFGDKIVLEDLNFTINKGDIFGLVGHNGCGKTTTLRIILGLLEIEGGSVRVFGDDPFEKQTEVLEKCGVLSEDNGLYEAMTVYDNLKFFARAYKCYDENFEKKIDTLLNRFNILENKHDVIKNFSQGMKKKTALIRTLFHEPEIVLLDEPTNGLDPVSVQTLSDIISEMSSKGSTFILTTHNLDIVSKICNKIVIVKDGIDVYTSSLGSDSDLMRTSISYLNELDDKTENTIREYNNEFKVEINTDLKQLIVYTKDATQISNLVANISHLGVYEIDRNAFDLTKIYLDKDKGETNV